MAFMDQLKEAPKKHAKEGMIDKALRVWPEAEAEQLREALHDLDRYTNLAIARASKDMSPSFAEATVATWRMKQGLRDA